MFEGNANITFLGGDWGNYGGADEEDSSMGTTGNDGPRETCPGDSGPQPQTNILFDGVTWHDVFYSTSLDGCTGGPGSCVEWGVSHPDCFEINGYVDGVTIQNSTFYHCGNTMLSLFTDQGNVDNVIARHNVFRDMAPTSYYGVQWVDTAAHTCNDNKFLDNTYMPNAPTAWKVNAPPRFECVTSSGSTGHPRRREHVPGGAALERLRHGHRGALPHGLAGQHLPVRQLLLSTRPPRFSPGSTLFEGPVVAAAQGG